MDTKAILDAYGIAIPTDCVLCHRTQGARLRRITKKRGFWGGWNKDTWLHTEMEAVLCDDCAKRWVHE